MADSDFVTVPLAGLLDRSYLAQRAALINPAKSMGVPTVGKPPGCCAAQEFGEGLQAELEGTTHLVIVDRDGNAVSMTTTIESGFGSYQMVRGFLLNNQLTDFSFTPVDSAGKPVANRVEAGKRPRSSMAPMMVFDGQMRLDAAVGSPGGANIIQYVAKTLIGLYDWNLDIQQSINLGNFGAATSATTSLERGSSVKDLGPALQAKGHTVSVVDINSGIQGFTFNGVRDNGNRSGLAAVLKPYSGWAGGADPRREARQAATDPNPRGETTMKKTIIAAAVALTAQPGQPRRQRSSTSSAASASRNTTSTAATSPGSSSTWATRVRRHRSATTRPRGASARAGSRTALRRRCRTSTSASRRSRRRLPSQDVRRNVKVTGWAIDLVPQYPFGNGFGVLGRIGYARTESSASYSGSGAFRLNESSIDKTHDGWNAGLGMSYASTPPRRPRRMDVRPRRRRRHDGWPLGRQRVQHLRPLAVQDRHAARRPGGLGRPAGGRRRSDAPLIAQQPHDLRDREHAPSRCPCASEVSTTAMCVPPEPLNRSTTMPIVERAMSLMSTIFHWSTDVMMSRTWTSLRADVRWVPPSACRCRTGFSPWMS
jgi:opacity protein-like surface antigen